MLHFVTQFSVLTWVGVALLYLMIGTSLAILWGSREGVWKHLKGGKAESETKFLIFVMLFVWPIMFPIYIIHFVFFNWFSWVYKAVETIRDRHTLKQKVKEYEKQHAEVFQENN